MKTPCVLLDLDIPAKVYVKLEGHNTTGSIKDRFARYVIGNAIENDDLRSGMTIVDISAGNTAAALAYHARDRGYSSRFWVPEGSAHETTEKLRQYDLEDHCELVPFVFDPDKPFEQVDEIRRLPPQYFWTRQYYRDDSHLMYAELAREIGDQVDGPIAFLAGAVGTGGSIMGAGKNLNESHVIAALSDPNSDIPGMRPVGVSLTYEGLTDTYEPKEVAQEVKVTVERAIDYQRILEEQKISAGLTAGAALFALISAINNSSENAVVILADGTSQVPSFSL